MPDGWWESFWVMATCGAVGRSCKPGVGRLSRKLPKSHLPKGRWAVSPCTLEACSLGVLSAQLFSSRVPIYAAKLTDQECTCSSHNIKQSFLLLNCALASFNLGASFWILALDHEGMETGLARTYKARVAGEENPWATPLPICPYHKP